jgi:hypothetical protein
MHVEGGAELDVARVVAGEVDMHQARNEVGALGIAVEVNALHEGRGAVAHTDDRDAYLAHVETLGVPRRRARGVVPWRKKEALFLGNLRACAHKSGTDAKTQLSRGVTGQSAYTQVSTFAHARSISAANLSFAAVTTIFFLPMATTANSSTKGFHVAAHSHHRRRRFHRLAPCGRAALPWLPRPRFGQPRAAGARRRRARPDYLEPDVELVSATCAIRRRCAARCKGVDAVYHFASAVGVGQSMYEVAHYTRVNNLGTAVLLEALIERPVKRWSSRRA